MTYPWRWHPDYLPLGNKIKEMREELEKYSRISLAHNPNEQVYVYQYPNCTVYEPNYGKFLRDVVKAHSSKSMLIICPSYYEVDKRGVSRLRGGLTTELN